MTATDVYTVVSQSFTGEVASGPLGITWGPLRFSCGGGIAGHGGDWWIDWPGWPDFRLGPYRTPTALRRGLRDLLIAYINIGRGVVFFEKSFLRGG